MNKKKRIKKSQPTSSQVHVPVAGYEEKRKKRLDKFKSAAIRFSLGGDKPVEKLADDSREVGKVAIIRGGKILLGTREDNGNYDFPGGRAKNGEAILDGTIREVLEETGIELDPDCLELIAHDQKEKTDKDTIVDVYGYLADLDEYPPISEKDETDGEMATLEWFDMSSGLPEDVIEHMHTPLEENVILQAIGVEIDLDVDGNPDLYPGINNLEGGALKSDEEPRADLQSAQELISGIDWEVDHASVDPLTARELAWENLAQDPLFYRKKRLAQDGTSDEKGDYDDEALENGFWLDLGSSTCRESGHIGLDLYPYDHGTAVHDLDTGIPFPDGSASKVRLANVVGDENLSDPKALLSEIHRVLMPGGEFVYEGPEDIYNYPEWSEDYPGLVMTDHEDDCDVEKVDGTNNLFRQKFTRVPDPATANDAEPRAPYGILPADALLSMDATGYHWSDSSGDRLMGDAGKDSLLKKGGPGSGRTPMGHEDKLQEARNQRSQTAERLAQARSEYSKAPKEKKPQAQAQLRQAMLDHQASNDLVRHHSKLRVNQSISKCVPILKASGMKRVVYCVVLEPDVVDAQDDFMTAEDIEEAAHTYMINARLIGSGHSKKIDAAPVESFIAPQDLEYQGQNGPQVVKSGSWVIGIKIFDEKEWQKVLNGEYTGVSVGGKGLRDEI